MSLTEQKQTFLKEEAGTYLDQAKAILKKELPNLELNIQQKGQKVYIGGSDDKDGSAIVNALRRAKLPLPNIDYVSKGIEFKDTKFKPNGQILYPDVNSSEWKKAEASALKALQLFEQAQKELSAIYQELDFENYWELAGNIQPKAVQILQHTPEKMTPKILAQLIAHVKKSAPKK